MYAKNAITVSMSITKTFQYMPKQMVAQDSAETLNKKKTEIYLGKSLKK
jgi:hypothetical protein